MPERPDPVELLRSVRTHWDAAHIESAYDLHLRSRRRRRARTAVLVSLAAAAVMALAWNLRGEPPDPSEATHAATHEGTHEASAAGAPPETAGPRDPVRLSDGSTLTPSEGGELYLQEASGTRVAVELLAGAVEADIVPRPGREVRIEVGEVVVTVLGTAFRVERGEHDVEVVVHRGRVAVDHPVRAGRERTVLGIGERARFELSVAAVPEEVSARRAPSPTPRPAAPHEAAPAPLEVPSTPTPAATDWRELAEDGAYDEAFAALSAAGPTSVSDSVEELLLAADAARLSGHPRDALAFLERAEAHAAGDPRAPLAAFSSGRIFAQLGRHADSAAAFERVLALEPSGSLAEDAMVRAAEAHERAGDHEAASALARRYLAAHPAGRGATRMRALEP